MAEVNNFIHETNIQIRFNDLDLLGHVNNAVYQHYFDLARMDYFGKVIGNKLDWHTFGVILAGITIEYIKPIQIFDKIAVRSRIDTLGEKSLSMSQEIYDIKSEKKCAVNMATMVGFSALQKATIPIPLSWKEKIMAFEEKVKLKYPL